MPRIIKRYVITRDLRVQDFQDCLEWLRAHGQHVNSLERYEGGIDYPHKPDQRKDVRFMSCQTALPRPNKAGNFSGDLTRIWKKAVQPEWHEDNRIGVKLDGDFTETELSYIHICMLSVLQCKSNVIENEERSISPRDTPEDISNYLNIDYAAALEKYTIPDPDYPEHLTDRRFACWNCDKLFTYEEYLVFSPYSYVKESEFYAVLSQYAHNSRRWCRECDCDHSYFKRT
jgi:hypothetical protein